jgi:hypothetical protein
LADLLSISGDHKAAIELARSGLDKRRQLHGKNPSLSTLKGVMTGLSTLADMLIVAKQFKEAEGPARESAQLADDLVAKHPDYLDWQQNQAIAHSKLSDIARQSHDLKLAREEAEKVRVIVESVASQRPDEVEWQRHLAFGLRRLATIQALQSDTAAAITNHVRSLTIRQNLAAKYPAVTSYQTDVANAAASLAELCESMGQQSGTNLIHFYKLELNALKKLEALNRLLPIQKTRITNLIERIRLVESTSAR